VAVGPFVVAGRVDERVLERGPQVVNLAIVGFRAKLASRVDVAHMEYEVDFGVLVNRVDERQGFVSLSRIGRARAVRRIAYTATVNVFFEFGLMGVPF
jgi:hypothetical protein